MTDWQIFVWALKSKRVHLIALVIAALFFFLGSHHKWLAWVIVYPMSVLCLGIAMIRNEHDRRWRQETVRKRRERMANALAGQFGQERASEIVEVLKDNDLL